MSTKYIIIIGSCYSGIGKGQCCSALGFLLKLRGHNVTCMKFDGYGNLNNSLINPASHGNCHVTDDGGECDLDVAHYERHADITVSKKNICTAGLIHKELIEEQEEGKYLGQTIQAIHFSKKVQEKILDMGKNHDVVLVEIGGSSGDQENYGFFEAVNRFKHERRNDVLIVLVAPVLWINTIKEFKTKPLQNSVKELRQYGFQPDLILCRTERPLPEKILDKVSDLTNVPREQIFEALDVQSTYQIPIEFYNRQIDDIIVDLLRLPRSACRIRKYKELAEKHINNNFDTINIGVISKYENEEEAYLNVKEALHHAGTANEAKINIHWIKAEELEKYKDQRGISRFFENIHGIIVPGGFDSRGIEGKIKAIYYSREKKIPFLGICLGLQLAVIEFARNVCHIEDANSQEFDKNAKNLAIHYVEGQQKLQENKKTKYANMRLGAFDCELIKDSKSYELYGNKLIQERHRHRYEVNPEYVNQYENKGLRVVGRNPQSNLIEIMELTDHPYFIGCQFHGEDKSKLISPSPLFVGLIAAAIKYRDENKEANNK